MTLPQNTLYCIAINHNTLHYSTLHKSLEKLSQEKLRISLRRVTHNEVGLSMGEVLYGKSGGDGSARSIANWWSDVQEGICVAA